MGARKRYSDCTELRRRMDPGIVRTPEGAYYAVFPTDNAWGFSLSDGVLEYPGGCGVGMRWTRVRDTHVIPGPVRVRLVDAILEGSRKAKDWQLRLDLGVEAFA